MRSAWSVAKFALGAAAATAMAAITAACSADNTTLASASSPASDTNGVTLASAQSSTDVASAPPTELSGDDARASLKNGGVFWRVDFGTLRSEAEAATALHSVRALGFNHARIIAESEQPVELAWKQAATSAIAADGAHSGRQKASVEKALVKPSATKKASASGPTPNSEKLAMASPSALKPQAPAPAAAMPSYAIAVGAFAVKSNADALSAKLSAYDAHVTPFARKGVEMWRVELDSPGSKDEARTALAFARALGFPHAWVVEQSQQSRQIEKSASNTIVNRGARTRNRVPRLRPSLNS